MKIQNRVLLETNEADLKILTTMCEDVVDPSYENLRDIKDSMVKIMEDSSGRGLAAPQVGLNKRILVMKNSSQDILFMVNPLIVKSSSTRMKYKEGCLSLPNKSVTTYRSRQVTVVYEDELGKQCTIRLGNVDSVCVQHEIDHLNGILMTKR